MIDLSHPFHPAMPIYPGDPAVEITAIDSTDLSTPDVRHVNLGQIQMSLHAGTHIDAPFHFLGNSLTIDQVPLDQCQGKAFSIRVSDKTIERQHLFPWEDSLRKERRVIFNTGWYRHWGSADYFTAHPVISESAARFLIDCAIVLVGIDTPSVDQPPFETHLLLLGAGIVIVENLTNLDALPESPFQFAALPLCIEGRDASPVRAVAWQ